MKISRSHRVGPTRGSDGAGISLKTPVVEHKEYGTRGSSDDNDNDNDNDDPCEARESRFHQSIFALYYHLFHS